MKSHRCRRIRALVLGLAACAAVAAPAGAQSAGDTPANSRSQATPTTKIGLGPNGGTPSRQEKHTRLSTVCATIRGTTAGP